MNQNDMGSNNMGHTTNTTNQQTQYYVAEIPTPLPRPRDETDPITWIVPATPDTPNTTGKIINLCLNF